jgi:4,5-dihydroxyphthalate decarboxylase
MTNALPLTYAGLHYFDRTAALIDGRVPVPGVELGFEIFPRVEELFRRQAQSAEFPVSEMSLGTYLVMVARGDCPFVGLPVFLSRLFRHRDVYVSAAAGIDGPADLRGKRIGVPEYQMTAAVWIREFLASDHGVRPEDLHWHTGGLREPEYRERLAITLPDGVRLDRIPADQTLEGMLLTGELDAMISTEPPRYPEAERHRVRRLFPDYGQVERDYYARTGIFPIMHLVVLRKDVYAAHPELAATFTRAFVEAKRIGREQLRFQPSLPVCLPWVQEQIEIVDRLFAGDAFPYGVEANRAVLDTITAATHAQGLTPRRVAVDELFAPETLALTDHRAGDPVSS